MRFRAASRTGRPRLPAGGAGLRQGLTSLAARCSPQACVALHASALHRQRRSGRASASALSLLALVVAAGCAGGDETTTVTVRETVTETTSGTVPSEAPAVVTVFMLRDGKVEPVTRGVVTGPEVLAAAALDQLLEGPTSDESQAGLETAIPEETERAGLEIAEDLAIVGLEPAPRNRASRAQIVYTLTALSNVKRVSFGGATPVTRSAFESATPSIFVASPLPGETVEPGFEVTGTANTFEANFNYELQDAAGKVLSKDFVTATSGSGTRGTFEFRVPYEVTAPTDGKLVVFELSAANGSRINEHEIPLRLE